MSARAISWGRFFKKEPSNLHSRRAGAPDENVSRETLHSCPLRSALSSLTWQRAQGEVWICVEQFQKCVHHHWIKFSRRTTQKPLACCILLERGLVGPFCCQGIVDIRYS